ncbi:MAG: AMP-binding protein [Firmicutes bacterium]|nr:AMP-binding protein [Bacillota bacterium]MDY4559254.1 AMP-binding protein [Eubacteriales bacterium]
MEFINKTLGEVINDLGKNYPDNLACKFPLEGYEKTWAEFDKETDEYAKGFMALGIQKGDKVAIWAKNTSEWMLTFFATAKIGAISVTVNTNYKIFELEYLLNQSDSKFLVMMHGTKDVDYVKIVEELFPELPTSENGLVSSKQMPFLERIIYADTDETPNGFMTFKDIKSYASKVSDEEFKARVATLDPQDVINIQYTSGTTGFPKGVMLTHYNIINNGKCIGDGMKFTEKDKLCICVPFFHCFGMVLAMMASITHATAMVPLPYSPLKVMKAISEEHCTAVHGVPTMFIAMLEHPDFKQYDFSSLRTGIMAGSPCPIKVMQQVIDEMNMKDIVIVFGQTEASPGCTMTTTNDSIEARVSTVGKAFPGVECKIIDPETGETLPPHKTGEFCARGYNIMRGYYKMPEATAQAIDKDGWLHSGDLCTVDENGYYKVVGRLKDMIIRGGENIYPKEIEEFLYTCPKISDVQVIGVPSQQYGEEVMAVIILKKGETMTEQEVKDLVKANMAKHKVPSYIRFVDAFPVTASGKIQKFKLREEAIEILNLQEAAKIETA